MGFSRKYNLERHMERTHSDKDEDSEVENISSDDAMDDSVHSGENSDSDELTDDSTDSEEEGESYENHNSQETAFQKLVDQAWEQVSPEQMEISHKERVYKARKVLRMEYKKSLLWYRDLRKEPIHRAIMETAQRLRDDRDFDYKESIESAISSRKYLLNRLIPSDTEGSDEEEAMHQ